MVFLSEHISSEIWPKQRGIFQTIKAYGRQFPWLDMFKMFFFFSLLWETEDGFQRKFIDSKTCFHIFIMFMFIENYIPLQNDLNRKLAHLSNDRLMKCVYRNRIQFTWWNLLEISDSGLISLQLPTHPPIYLCSHTLCFSVSFKLSDSLISVESIRSLLPWKWQHNALLNFNWTVGYGYGCDWWYLR